MTLQVTQCNILGHFRAMQSWSEILTTVIHFRSRQGLMLEYGAMSGYDVLHKAQFSLYFRGLFTSQCSYCIEVYQCAIICNAHCAMCIAHCALCILCNWNVQSCVSAHCVLLCNHVSCTMCNWNVFVHSLLLHSTRNDLIKRLLLYYSFHLFLPFHLSICFFVFTFHPFHLYICFHSVMHFSCSDLHSIFHFNDFCFFCHNLKFTSYSTQGRSQSLFYIARLANIQNTA